MNKHEINVEWQKDMAFKTDLNGHSITVDAKEEFGGKNSGPSPKPLLLVGLAGCTGMDVVSILKKMRVELEDFNVKVTGILSEEHPKTYEKMEIIYQFKGDNLPVDKLNKAVKLSEEKYCGVIALYKKAIPLISKVEII